MTIQNRVLERLRGEFEKFAGDWRRGDLVLYECLEKSPVPKLFLAGELLATARPELTCIELGEGDDHGECPRVHRWVLSTQGFEEGNERFSWFAELSEAVLNCVNPLLQDDLRERYRWMRLVQEIGRRTNHPVIRSEPEYIHRYFEYSGSNQPKGKHTPRLMPVPQGFFESPEEAAETYAVLSNLDNLPVSVTAMFCGMFRASVYAIDALLEDESLLKSITVAMEVDVRKGTSVDDWSAAPDFNSVHWFGRSHRFSTGNQRHAVRLLIESWKRGGHGLSQATIGEAIGSSDQSFQLAKVFRVRRPDGTYEPHSAWGTMIQPNGKGVYRLVRPESRKNP